MNLYTDIFLVFNRWLLLVTLPGLLFVISQNAFSHRIACPICCLSSELTDENINSRTCACPHCTYVIFGEEFRIIYIADSRDQNLPPIQPAVSGLTASVGELSLERPAALATPAHIGNNLDFSTELANILRPEGTTNRNLVFSPTATASLLTLLTVSAHLQENHDVARQTNRVRNSDRLLASGGRQGSGYRDASWFLARNGATFSDILKDPQFNPDSQTSYLLPGGLNHPDSVNGQINQFLQEGFPDNDRPGNLSPRLMFSPTAQLVAMTVATFNHNWRDVFTRDTMSFTTLSGQTLQISAMTSAEPVRVNYAQDSSGWEVIILPYLNEGDRMIILIPPNRATPTPPSDLDSARIRQLVNSASSTYIRLTMPAFLVSGTHELHTVLQGTSLSWMVSPESFSPNLTSPAINVSNIESRQIIVFESDEIGSRAVAMTETGIDEAYIATNHNIIVNRPFTALVVNSEGMVCFHIEINNPDE